LIRFAFIVTGDFLPRIFFFRGLFSTFTFGHRVPRGHETENFSTISRSFESVRVTSPRTNLEMKA